MIWIILAALGIPIRLVVGGLGAAADASLPVKALGEHPASIRLRLDDGSVVAVAAPEEAAALLAGPFGANTVQAKEESVLQEAVS